MIYFTNDSFLEFLSSEKTHKQLITSFPKTCSGDRFGYFGHPCGNSGTWVMFLS